MTTARAKRELIGHIPCPVCETPGADVREDSNGRAYVVGDCCVSLTRSSSRAGSAAIRKRMTPLKAVEPAPAAEKKLPKGEHEAENTARPSRGALADVFGFGK